MKILAIDSSGMVASAAILQDDVLVGEYSINHKKTHSQTLLPMIDEVVKMTETDLHEIDAIAVAAGPGSFTGLRIGSATAKGLGLALDKPLISVPTLEGLAYNAAAFSGLICPMMDARRKQVYTGVYRFEGDQFETVIPQKACPIEEIIEDLNGLGEQVLLLGDGVPVARDMVEEKLTVSHLYAPAHMSRQRAGAVAVRAAQLFRQGKTENADDHKPIYLRKSQAERELEKQGSNLEELGQVERTR
ncbi:MAG: tRNA (adenosine(37)-N6)-threonylcarbamoyltransferase complex dimerization subunit type 1 TsaB [Lachnospiraceae bacterium]|nr:tRNA (adenosine(37)-N6)-threonylcarbamoyltransferase complex dimerization subunit type 1 TsaB [Lachnospiraceae bacterium]